MPYLPCGMLYTVASRSDQNLHRSWWEMDGTYAGTGINCSALFCTGLYRTVVFHCSVSYFKFHFVWITKKISTGSELCMPSEYINILWRLVASIVSKIIRNRTEEEVSIEELQWNCSSVILCKYGQVNRHLFEWHLIDKGCPPAISVTPCAPCAQNCATLSSVGTNACTFNGECCGGNSPIKPKDDNSYIWRDGSAREYSA